MKLPRVDQFDCKGKRVLIRMDLDVPLGMREGKREVVEEERIKEGWPTVEFVLEKGASEVILAGHLGRPKGEWVKELDLLPVAEKIAGKRKVAWEKGGLGDFPGYRIGKEIFLLENLRFWEGEEKNEREFAKKLAGLADFFVNEAFAVSHREHASVVGVPEFLPSGAGFHFAKEVKNLSLVWEKGERPVVFLIGGAKPETKLPLVQELVKRADLVLLGGALVLAEEARNLGEKVLLAGLREGKEDIDDESIEKFREVIRKAGTIVWNGPLGKYEEERGEKGTRLVGEEIGKARGFKVVGGGDTIAALTKFGLKDKIDYISTGGGAMLEFLAKGTLPGIEALLKNIKK